MSDGMRILASAALVLCAVAVLVQALLGWWL